MMTNPTGSPHPLEQLAGKAIGNGDYVLQALHHKSRMSVLYRSLDRATGKTVAVKILLHDRYLDRFKNEARLADELQHPNIVKTTRYQVNGERIEHYHAYLYYIVMRWLSQDSLESIIQKGNANVYFTPRRGVSFTGGNDTTIDSRLGVAMLVLDRLGNAFDYLHQQVRIINRDVKPSNIQFHNHQPFLLDFGIAKVIQDDNRTMVDTSDGGLTNVNELPGTFRYMAPEQWTFGELTGRTDQYQFALTLYELISGGNSPYDEFRRQAGLETGLGRTGSTRFERNRQIWSEAHVTKQPTPLTKYVPQLPAGVWPVLERAMHKLPAERYSTMTEFAYALFETLPRQLQNDLPVNINAHRFNLSPSGIGTGIGTGVGDYATGREHSRGYWATIALLAVVLVALICVGAFVFVSTNDEGNEAGLGETETVIDTESSATATVLTMIAVVPTETPAVLPTEIQLLTETPTDFIVTDVPIDELPPTAIDTATQTASSTQISDVIAPVDNSEEPTVSEVPPELPTEEPLPTETFTTIPTETPLPTETFTEIPSPTSTDTPTNTATPTQTYTPTSTFTPTLTPIPTQTPTLTPTATREGGGTGVIVYDTGTENEREIYIYNPINKRVSRITNNSNEDRQPTLSPDGNQVAYVSVSFSEYAIVLYNIETGRENRIPMEDMTFIGSLDWSPNGNEIVMEAAIEGRNSKLYSYDLNANQGEFLVDSTSTIPYFRPRWSPDGQRIVFHSNFEGNFEIYIFNISNGTTTRVTNSVDSIEAGAAWSPTGSEIVFASNQSGNFDIYSTNLLTGRTLQLTTNPEDDALPFFSPDGRRIVYSSLGLLHIIQLDSANATETIEDQGIVGAPFSWR